MSGDGCPTPAVKADEDVITAAGPCSIVHPLRLHPDYEIVALDALGPDQRAAIETAGGDGTAAVLVSRQGGGPAYAVSAEAYRLLNGVLGTVEGRRSVALPADRARDLAMWVLDCVLEVQADQQWWSGPSAMEFLELPGLPCVDAAETAPLGILSRQALDYAASLRLRTTGELARRLYCYHRQPANASWSRLLATTAGVRAWLDRPATAATLARDWVGVTPPPDNDRWRIFHHRRSNATRVPASRHKLYVSPQPGYLRDALEVAVAVFTAYDVPIFKVADDMYGVLRPDKLVAYFSSPPQLEAVAAELRKVTAGLPAQGVPFTAACTDDGLLSWAVDPPPRATGHGGASSWRGWVVGRLAQAMVQAQTAGSPASVVDYALRRIWLDGVDVATWTPVERASAGEAESL
nr:hypothetical protein OH826_24635 [Streptomyces sp. NBC_00899]